MEIQLRLAYEDAQVVRELFAEYTQMLYEGDPTIAQYLGQQNYDDELRHLDKKYGLPRGRLYIAWVDGQAAGCVALRPMDGGAGELKRLYVRPQFRGHKLGRMLVEQILADARAESYSHLLLDTLDFLPHAIALYREVGFYDIARYNDSPMDGSVYMRYDF